MEDFIHIALAIDKPYIQHAGVLLCSLFEHNLKNKFIIHLIIDFDENKELEKLRALVCTYGQYLSCLRIQNDKLKNYKLSDHATTAVYYRLLLPKLLSSKLKKVLYLDSDIVIKKDLLPLWKTDLAGYPLAAVREPLFNRHQQLGIPEDTLYFNSGVMLINLPVWRNEEISETTMDFVERHPERISYWDQDGLNAVLSGNWLELHPKWNQQTMFFEAEKYKNFSIDEALLKESLQKPGIIHYSAKFKPWDYWCSHPLKEEYFFYLKKTPWRNFYIVEFSFLHMLKQKIKKNINKFLGVKIFEVYA